MFKKLLIYICLISFVGNYAQANLDVKARTAILMDYHSGEILYEKEADMSIYPASMTKIMTAILAFDLIKSGELKLDEKFLISEKAWRLSSTGSSSMFIMVNDEILVKDLLKGIIQQFNLVLLPSKDNRSTIEVYQFDEWLREGEIKDWTDKYDTSIRMGISHTVEDLEADILLQNAEDEDRFSKQTKDNDPNFQYGTLRLIADNNISQGEKTVGDYFAPVILGGSTGVNPLDNETPSTRIDLNTTFIYPHLYKFDNTKLTSFSCKPRIGYKVNNPLPTNSAFYIGFPFNELEVTGSYGTISNVADLPVTSSVSNDLHFNNTYTTFTNNPTLNLNNGVNNYTNYYETYFDSLYWEGSKKLTIDLYFNPTEFKNINLNDRILIKGTAFRINRIIGFNLTSRDVVTVELIKLYPEYWQL